MGSRLRATLTREQGCKQDFALPLCIKLFRKYVCAVAQNAGTIQLAQRSDESVARTCVEMSLRGVCVLVHGRGLGLAQNAVLEHSALENLSQFVLTPLKFLQENVNC